MNEEEEARVQEMGRRMMMIHKEEDETRKDEEDEEDRQDTRNTNKSSPREEIKGESMTLSQVGA